MAVLRFLSVVILAVWIGGLAVLGAIAAPVVFAALQTHDPIAGRALAGEVFGAVFQRFQPVTWILGGALLAMLGARAALGPRPVRLSVRVLTVLVMVALSLASSLLIAPRIDRIRRETSGAVSSLAESDARKVEFNRLHGLSSSLMLATLLAGLGLLWFETRDPH